MSIYIYDSSSVELSQTLLNALADTEFRQNIVKINPTHDIPFRTVHNQTNLSLLAQCRSVLIPDQFQLGKRPLSATVIYHQR